MDDPHASLPESDPAAPVPDSVSNEGNDEQRSLSHLPAEHRNVVRRLLHQVEQAVNTIEQLRTENEQLRQRVDELEAQPAYPDDETVLTFDDDPDALREHITRFIDAIDTYLESAPSAAVDAEVDEETDA